MKKLGFTLIELLIVVGIIAILVVVVFASLNPLELFAESRNAQRWSNVSELLTALHVYTVQKEGVVPNQDQWSEGVYYVLGTSVKGCAETCGSIPVTDRCLDLTDMLKSKKISQIPIDPLQGDSNNTGYYVYRESGAIITVGSCFSEQNVKIKLSR